MVSLHLEGIKVYRAPGVKAKLFMPLNGYKEIFRSRDSWRLFLLPKLGLAAIIVTAYECFDFIGLLISFPIALIFTLMMDGEIYKLNRSVSSPVPEDSDIRVEAGWYPDPWGFEVSNLERFWTGMEWSTDTRSVVK